MYNNSNKRKYISLKEVIMTAEELYSQVMGSAELQQELEAATDAGTLDAFLSSKGCSASAEEFSACVASHTK